MFLDIVTFKTQCILLPLYHILAISIPDSADSYSRSSCALLPSHGLTNLILSGYDFGYFVKLLTAVSLPTTEETFFDLLRIWFPTVYDIKFMMRACKGLKGGLQDVADDLGVCYLLVIMWSTD